jgi:hypothetical protein
MNNTYNYFSVSFFLNTVITITLLIILRLLQNFEIKILTSGYNFSISIRNFIILIKT